MMAKSHTSTLALGLALFSMFFGSGNLIFPLFVGYFAESNFIYASLGFISTAVLLPFAGVATMVLFKGMYHKFFAQFTTFTSRLLPWILLTVWIPLGSGPRCITLANASLNLFLGEIPPYIFGTFYTLLILLVLKNKTRLIDILGYVLTPLLLLSLFGIVLGTMLGADTVYPVTTSSKPIFWLSLVQGYNTMDMIAAFFFSSSTITLLHNNQEKKAYLKVFKASLIGMALLAIVYFSLICVAAFHRDLLESVPKEQMLVFLAKHVLGPQLGFISCICISLACFTTSIALTIVYSDFLFEEKLFKQRRNAVWATLLIGLVMSNFGLKGVTFITEPILQVFYPIMLLMIVYTLCKIGYNKLTKT